MKRVLVVEDELSMRETLKCLMVRWNYEVTFSKSVKEAQKCFSEDRGFDIVVSDFLLPDGDGKQFYGWLRNDLCSSVPFLMLSGNYCPLDEDSFEFVAKPFSISHLRAVMDRLSGQQQKTAAVG